MGDRAHAPTPCLPLGLRAPGRRSPADSRKPGDREAASVLCILQSGVFPEGPRIPAALPAPRNALGHLTRPVAQATSDCSFAFPPEKKVLINHALWVHSQSRDNRAGGGFRARPALAPHFTDEETEG